MIKKIVVLICTGAFIFGSCDLLLAKEKKSKHETIAKHRKEKREKEKTCCPVCKKEYKEGKHHKCSEKALKKAEKKHEKHVKKHVKKQEKTPKKHVKKHEKPAKVKKIKTKKPKAVKVCETCGQTHKKCTCAKCETCNKNPHKCKCAAICKKHQMAKKDCPCGLKKQAKMCASCNLPFNKCTCAPCKECSKKPHACQCAQEEFCKDHNMLKKDCACTLEKEQKFQHLDKGNEEKW